MLLHLTRHSSVKNRHSRHPSRSQAGSYALGADAFFPSFDLKQWQVTPMEIHAADEEHAFAFEFVDYKSKKAYLL